MWISRAPATEMLAQPMTRVRVPSPLPAGHELLVPVSVSMPPRHRKVIRSQVRRTNEIIADRLAGWLFPRRNMSARARERVCLPVLATSARHCV
jgi:hypothetical protein